MAPRSPAWRAARASLRALGHLGAASLAVLAACGGVACSNDDAPASPPKPARPPSACSGDRAKNAIGSGSFGCWIDDANGLPAYEWTLPEGDPRGEFTTKRDAPDKSNDHWHQVGNTRVRGMAHTDGRIRMSDGTRGTKWVSSYSEAGISIQGVDIPHDLRRLVFGMGYAAEIAEHAGVQVTRTAFAPWGAGVDDPVLYLEYRLENRASETRSVSVRELWDGGIHPINLEVLYATLPDAGDGNRDAFMAKFEQTAAFDATHGGVTIDTDARAGVAVPPRTEAADGDYHPGTLALVLLGAEPDAFAFEKRVDCPDCTPATLETTGASTTHVGPPPFGVLAPEGKTTAGPAGAELNAFVAELSKTTSLAPGESARLVFALAYDADEEIGPLLDRLRAAPPPSSDDNGREIDAVVPKVSLPEGSAFDQAIARELRWHGYYLLSAANYEEYYGTHNIDQAAAYGFLQGLRGTPRDGFAAAIGALYLRPDLARETITYTLMTATPADAKMSYATANFGQLTDAILHDAPSDLDLWFLWAIAEYVGATRDFGFLDAPVAYYPPTAGVTATVLERIARSLDRIITFVGFGEHGMLRVGSGDWNDAIRYAAPDIAVFESDGESMFNTVLAAYVFPRVADLVASRDPALADQFGALGAQLGDVVRGQFNGKWFPRAWDGAGGPIGNDRIFLEHHAWLLVSDVPTAEQRASVIGSIDEHLASESPIGAWLVYPPMKQAVLVEGWDVNGGIWANVNGMLTWGLSRSDPARAWRELGDNSMAKHAEAYPDIWYGIWSGPDSYIAAYAERPGESPYHGATPLSDFPVTNSNRHAMPLIDLVKLAGVDCDAKGISIQPRLPFATFSVETPLLAVSYGADAVEGRVEFAEAGEVTLQLPAGVTDPAVTVNGATVTPTAASSESVTFVAPAGRTTFRVGP